LTEDAIIKSIGEFAKTGKIFLNLDQILGEGGEGLVVEQDLMFMERIQNCAVKLAHYKTDYQIFGRNFFDHLKKSKEFYIGTHEVNEFRIKHLFNTMVNLNGQSFHVTSTLLLYINISQKITF